MYHVYVGPRGCVIVELRLIPLHLRPEDQRSLSMFDVNKGLLNMYDSVVVELLTLAALGDVFGVIDISPIFGRNICIDDRIHSRGFRFLFSLTRS